jgi:DNA-binding transcriptional ArsR family regulator
MIMQNLERNTIKVVAKLSPWLAPLPSAYFVGRSAMIHLALPLLVAVIVAAIIETLGLATVHTALWAYDWNTRKRKSDPSAPVILAVTLGGVYIVATLGLVVFLEVWPMLATYAPAIFPALAVVGAVNLALISRQEQRETDVKEQKAADSERRRARHVKRQVSIEDKFDTRLDTLRATRRAKRDAKINVLLQFYAENPGAGVSRASEAVGVSRQTIYNYLRWLEENGQVARKNGRVEILGWRDS